MPSSLQKFFSAHIVAALIFITVPGALAYQQFKKGTAQQKIDSILFLGELAPKLDSKTITTLFFAKNESINFSELKTVLDYQKIPQTVFSLDKDWLLFSNLMKTLKSADDITFALSFFSSKAMTEAQVTLLIGEYSRVRKGIPWTTDFMTLVQYPQSLDTMKRFLASTRKDLNRLALHLAAFQLDSSAVPEIQRVIEKFDPFNQRFALKTLSVLEGRAFGLMDWKPAVVVQKPLKAVKGKPIREIASVPQDYRLFCENYTVPDFKHELSKDQVNGMNICVRFRARNADLRTKIMVENLSWFENTPVDSDDIQFIKSVFSKSKEPS